MAEEMERLMWNSGKSLYRQHLEKNGFVSTRAHDLEIAIHKLHAAICQVDSQPTQRKALTNLMNSSVRDLIDEFAKIEELRRAHDIERS